MVGETDGSRGRKKGRFHNEASFCECDGISQLLCVKKEDISADIFSAVGEVYWLFQIGLLKVSNIWTDQTEASLCDLLNTGDKEGHQYNVLRLCFNHNFI